MNKDLKDKFYKLPNSLLKLLKTNLSKSSSKDLGYERLSNLVNDGGSTYGQIKKIKHEMESDMSPEKYNLIGGDDLLLWVNTSLDQSRGSVDGVKRQRMESGETNQFKKPHTKNSGENNPTNVRVVKAAKNSKEIKNNRPVYEEINRVNEIIKLIN